MLADERLRTHHHLWHFVRDERNWSDLSDDDREALTEAGWNAPRFGEEEGAGVDFLGMHRHMIRMVDRMLGTAGNDDWPRVTGWDPIPWADDDADWPVPLWQTTPPSWATAEQWEEFTDLAERSRSNARVAEMKELARLLRSEEYLEGVSLDELGTSIEWSIHGWMHIRWSGAPAEDAFSSGASNDWLFVPWSSHVNSVFWKLHGWIDERIEDWERVTGEQGDLTGAWAGPTGLPDTEPHLADVRLLRNVPARETAPLPMAIREHVVEGLLRR